MKAGFFRGEIISESFGNRMFFDGIFEGVVSTRFVFTTMNILTL